ncbi:Serine/threonine protein kinase [Handroanthus impetiginosus]|uniref:Serine/threonine protein kinase n=1 Tax=Handroanthus impetiginosus TaxID=429701 RepID=A0A2G9HB79_9LAMI|nr:Serine/threonine protein kinase [Handroanthus impetiginosus]
MKHVASEGSLIAGAALGSCFVVITFAALFVLYTAHKENQKKIEKFLEDYRALKPTRFSYSDIRRISHQFSEKIGEGGYGIVYKGKLSNKINVAVKVFNNSEGNGEEFVNEVGTIGRTHHVNVVHLIGFCAEGFRRALVYEFSPNDSLEKFIFQAERNSLGWKKLQDITLGIANGIEYLHQGCDQQIFHFDIKPHNILLDHKFNPKICDFGLAKLCSNEQSAVTMTVARGTMGYIAPEVLSRTFGKVSYNSDVYSFGMLLLEMVGCRKNVDENVNTSKVYFPQWIYRHLNIVGEDIWARIDEAEDGNIARKLSIVGLWCIQWHPNDRPSMKQVVQMLEGDKDNLTMPPNPFPDTNAANSIAEISGKRYQIELPLIMEAE